MEVLSSRILRRSHDPERARRFYRDVLGLAIYREFGPAESPGTVFFLGQGFLEVSGPAGGVRDGGIMAMDGPSELGHARADGGAVEPAAPATCLWLQVRDVHAEHDRLREAGVHVGRPPRSEPWGLVEMWIEDPDGMPIVLVQVPEGHPLRRDPR